MKNTHKKYSEEAFENRELGASPDFVRKARPSKEKALDKKLNLQIISIRLQKNLIEELKTFAKENGLGYQPYIRQILTHHIHTEKRKREKNFKIIGN